MKLWYDDKKIPAWVEFLGAIFLGAVFGILFAIGVLGISFGNLLASFF